MASFMHHALPILMTLSSIAFLVPRTDYVGARSSSKFQNVGLVGTWVSQIFAYFDSSCELDLHHMLGLLLQPTRPTPSQWQALSRLPNGPMGGSPIVEQVRISHLPLDALQNLSKFVGWVFWIDTTNTEPMEPSLRDIAADPETQVARMQSVLQCLSGWSVSGWWFLRRRWRSSCR